MARLFYRSGRSGHVTEFNAIYDLENRVLSHKKVMRAFLADLTFDEPSTYDSKEVCSPAKSTSDHVRLTALRSSRSVLGQE